MCVDIFLDDLPRPLPDRFKEKLQKDVEFILSKDIPGLEKIYLFGSCARGDFSWDSDLDIAVITNQLFTDHYLRGEISDVLEELEGLSTDVIFRTDEDCGVSSIFNVLFNQDKKLIWRRE